MGGEWRVVAAGLLACRGWLSGRLRQLVGGPTGGRRPQAEQSGQHQGRQGQVDATEHEAEETRNGRRPARRAAQLVPARHGSGSRPRSGSGSGSGLGWGLGLGLGLGGRHTTRPL